MTSDKYSHMGIDYTIEESRFGLFISSKTDGTEMVTSGTLDDCIRATNDVHIPVLLGCFEGYTSEPRSGTVGGKLWLG